MEYEAVIGLEVHVQIRTKTKMFTSVEHKFAEPPNTLTDPVIWAFPGVLPVLNFEAIKRTIELGLMLGCKIPEITKWDRKNYFYPDSPKNYQLSQYDQPLCLGGGVEIELPAKNASEMGEHRIVRLTRIHLEEDVGKLTHFNSDSLVDYNRAGTPLMEIVSEPDMHSSEEVFAYLTSLKNTISCAGISDCDMEKGQMRCDVNVSVRPKGSKEFGVKVEMKNINSISNARNSIDYEIKRQIDCLKNGGQIVQETRRWDDNKEYSYAMRSKEDAQDYRYFPDPDLVPVYISDEWLESIRSKQPEFRTEKMKRYKEEYDIPEYDIDIITGSKHLADIFEASVALGSQPKKVSNWLMVETMRLLKEKEMEPEDIRFSPEHLSRLIALVDGKVINSSVAKEVFQVMFEEDVDPEQYVEEKGLKTVNDEGALRKVVEEVIAANPQSVEDYHNGKEKAIGFLVGQTMKAMKGKADPASVNQMLKELL